jgi:pimeloyl-ACP methyl ester carboxylesterase
MRRIVYVAIALIALWIVIGYVATIPVVGNHTYWRTFRTRPEEFGLKAQDVSFRSRDGIQLRGWYIPADGDARGTVVISHGINGNRSDMVPRAAFLVPNHYNAFLIDLRDHGESAGTYAGPGYMESLDILGAVNYLQAHGEQTPIVALGHSYGAVASLYAAAQSPNIAAVIADSAYLSFEDMVQRAANLLAQDPERSFWERLGLRIAGFREIEQAVIPIYYLRTGVWMDSRKADSLLAIARIGTRPILFIAGEQDKICPPDNTRAMYQAALSPQRELLIVPGAEHDSTYTTSPKLYESTVIQFLDALPRPPLNQVPPGRGASAKLNELVRRFDD